jgi:aminoglycoside phosphotransferase (APT) family kinase protein
MLIHQIKRESGEFQQPVDESDLKLQLSRELFGEIISEVIELQAGLFNNTYRIVASEKSYILKVAPDRNADVFYNERYLMKRERSVSEYLQSVSSLVPVYLSFFKIGDRDAFIQPLIQGTLWHDVISTLTETENAHLWRELGAFAKQLHSCSGNEFGYPAPHDRFDKWSEFIMANVEGMVADCQRLGVLCEEIESYLGLLPNYLQMLDQVDTAKLLHGDLWPRNVIIDGTGEDIHITAVIDGERAFWGDPASDWVLILYGVPDDFWHGYGENLMKSSNPALIAVYQGMYFILNILEAVRFRESDKEPRKYLYNINKKLTEYL